MSPPEAVSQHPLAHEPLVGRGVARALVAALVVVALGLGAGALGAPEAGGVLRTSGILVASVALVLLFARRGQDRLEAIPARSAIVIAIAAGLAAIGVIWLLNSGPDRPIGIVGAVAAVGFVTAASAAAASTAVLIRPHVEPMVAHIWAGIGGAGFAIPFMAAGAAPELIMAAAVLIGLADRAGHRRRARALEARERALAGQTIGGADPRDVQRMSERGPTWTRGQRRLALILGCAAIGTVVVAWAIGIAVGGGAADTAATGQGFAGASIAAVPLAVQAALLRGSLARLRRWLILGGGMLGLAALALLAVPAEAVFLAAIAAQSVAVALLAGSHTRLARAVSTESAVLFAIVAATVWWLAVVSTGGLVLAFVAVVTTLVSLRRGPRSRDQRRSA